MTDTPSGPGPHDGRGARAARSSLTIIQTWLAATTLGLVAMALLVGAVAGLGAAGFRDLIFLFTWLFTGHDAYGQLGHQPSLHLPFLGIWFVLVAPVLAGLLYGPLIQRFAPEARGHGVPEVMLAVAENGGRIRPQVSLVKALASALCIGGGGSVGREGPIVQIGSAFASTLGQLVRMSEGRMRIIVACGAAGGIAATFNAPVTGLFFGFEIILKEFSAEALAATILSAVTADVISRAFFGSAPFFGAVPHGLHITNDIAFVLVALLGVIAGAVGVLFQKTVYRGEDAADRIWRSRPQWLRPVAGGFLLGGLLLLLPQMYGVGYPVMDRVFAGHYVIWFVLLLLAGKILATSLTLWIGGSGGVFAPSLFIGAATGTAFGVVAHHLFGPVIGPVAVYGVVGMGAVFAGGAQAPLTAIASVAEMTGNFTLTLPIMLACGLASQVARQMSHGSIYTTKLLRRGIDIERPKAIAALRALTVAQVMHPLPEMDGQPRVFARDADTAEDVDEATWQELVGSATRVRRPPVLFADEDLEQARRQLVLAGRDGLPVLSHEGQLRGWVTGEDILRALATGHDRGAVQIGEGVAVSVHSGPVNGAAGPAPASGYELFELRLAPDSPAVGRRIAELDWPGGSAVVAVTCGREVRAAEPELVLRAGGCVLVLAPAVDPGAAAQQAGGLLADAR
ncbi:MAG TPA: chloride channel protein [Solirubrobacteraceae bacterium]|nr:chloride channel protein [Solirubrobacteraceae bacterium]